MNETIGTIYRRKSSRNYSERQIPEDVVGKLLECACQAPSGMNAQGWGFTLVRDRGTIETLNRISKRRLLWAIRLARIFIPWKTHKFAGYVSRLKDPNFSIFHGAPLLVFVCVKKDAVTGTLDGAAAAENMFLAAESLGIGSCWIGVAMPLNTSGKARGILGIPKSYKIVAPLILGYSEDKSEKKERKPPVVFKEI